MGQVVVGAVWRSTRAGPRWLVAALIATLPGCAGGSATSRGDDPRPLVPPGATAPAATPPAPAPTTPAPTDPAPTDTAPTDPDGATTAAGAPPADPDRATVQATLDRYARALTDLSADPGALDRPDSPAAAAWAGAVVPGAALAEDVAARVRARAAAGVVVVPPAPGGTSWRFHALQVVPRERPGTREWTFTWCSWSPGIGRSVATGEVVDDIVAHGRGIGSVQEVDGTARVASLDQTDLIELPAGSPDPCGG